MSLANLVGHGLEREATDREEIGRFIAKIDRKLADSKARSISLDSRFDLAWEAALYRKTNRRDQAREHLTTATAMYRELSMQSWLEQAGAQAKELG